MDSDIITASLTTDSDGNFFASTDTIPSSVLVPKKLSRGESSYFLFHAVMMGVVGLLLFNSYLSTLGFFEQMFPSYKPTVYFSIPYFASSLIVNVFMGPIGSYISIKNRVLYGGLALAVLLITFPGILYLVQDTMYGYILFFILIGIQGFFSTILQCTCFGIAVIMGNEFAGMCGSGMAVAGVLLNLLMMLFLGALPINEIIQVILYYFMDALLIVFVIVNQLYIDKTEFMKTCYEISKGSANNEEKKITMGFMFGIAMKIPRYCLEMVMIYVVSLSVFPALLMSHHLSFCKNPNSEWEGLLISVMYNTMDLGGRLISTGIQKYVRPLFISILIYSRFVFIPWVIYLKYASFSGSGFDATIIITTLIIGLTNGIATNILFIKAPSSDAIKDSERQQAGFIMILSLFLGLLSGSILNIPLNDIHWNKIF